MSHVTWLNTHIKSTGRKGKQLNLSTFQFHLYLIFAFYVVFIDEIRNFASLQTKLFGSPIPN